MNKTPFIIAIQLDLLRDNEIVSHLIEKNKDGIISRERTLQGSLPELEGQHHYFIIIMLMEEKRPWIFRDYGTISRATLKITKISTHFEVILFDHSADEIFWSVNGGRNPLFESKHVLRWIIPEIEDDDYGFTLHVDEKNGGCFSSGRCIYPVEQ